MSFFDGFIDIASAFLGNSWANDAQDDQQSFNAREAALARQDWWPRADKMMNFEHNQAANQRQWAGYQAQYQRDWSGQQAQYQRDWSGQQAQLARDWQQQMASTAYQRTVGDLKKAGLNPMLAYMKGPAATPSAGVPSSGIPSSGIPSGAGGHAPGVGNSPSASASMRQVVQPRVGALAGAQGDLLRSQSALNVAHASKASAEAREIEARIPTYAVEIDKNTAAAGELRERTKLTSGQITRLESEIFKLNASAYRDQAETALAKAREAMTGPEKNLIVARTYAEHAEEMYKRALAAETDLRSDKERRDIPRQEREKTYWESPVGAADPYITRGVGKAVSSAVGALGLGKAAGAILNPRLKSVRKR